jgi:hypothetical protein
LIGNKGQNANWDATGRQNIRLLYAIKGIKPRHQSCFWRSALLLPEPLFPEPWHSLQVVNISTWQNTFFAASEQAMGAVRLYLNADGDCPRLPPLVAKFQLFYPTAHAQVVFAKPEAAINQEQIIDGAKFTLLSYQRDERQIQVRIRYEIPPPEGFPPQSEFRDCKKLLSFYWRGAGTEKMPFAKAAFSMTQDRDGKLTGIFDSHFAAPPDNVMPQLIG